jgi:hypothetical protein
MRPETAAYFNALARELRANPRALEHRFARQVAENFGGAAREKEQEVSVNAPTLSQQAYRAWTEARQAEIDARDAGHELAAEHLARATSAIWTARTILIDVEAARAQGGAS